MCTHIKYHFVPFPFYLEQDGRPVHVYFKKMCERKEKTYAHFIFPVFLSGENRMDFYSFLLYNFFGAASTHTHIVITLCEKKPAHTIPPAIHFTYKLEVCCIIGVKTIMVLYKRIFFSLEQQQQSRAEHGSMLIGSGGLLDTFNVFFLSALTKKLYNGWVPGHVCMHTLHFCVISPG